MRGTSLRNQKRGSRDNCLLKKLKTRGHLGDTERSRDNYMLNQKTRGYSCVTQKPEKGEQKQLLSERKKQQTRGYSRVTDRS